MHDEVESNVIATAKKKVAEVESCWGKAHPKLIKALQNLSDLYLVLEKYADAEPIYWRILEIQHRLYGNTNPVECETLLSLGELHEAQDNLDFAAQFYQGALWILDQNKDFQSDIVGRLLLKLYGVHKLNKNAEGVAAVENRLYMFLKREQMRSAETVHVLPSKSSVAVVA